MFKISRVVQVFYFWILGIREIYGGIYEGQSICWAIVDQKEVIGGIKMAFSLLFLSVIVIRELKLRSRWCMFSNVKERERIHRDFI